MGEPDFSEWIDFDHKNTQMFVMFSCGGLVAGCQAPPNSCSAQNGGSYNGKWCERSCLERVGVGGVQLVAGAAEESVDRRSRLARAA